MCGELDSGAFASGMQVLGSPEEEDVNVSNESSLKLPIRTSDTTDGKRVCCL